MKQKKEAQEMSVLTKPIDRAFVVRSDKWDEFLAHKTDSKVLARCNQIDKLIKESKAEKNENSERF